MALPGVAPLGWPAKPMQPPMGNTGERRRRARFGDDVHDGNCRVVLERVFADAIQLGALKADTLQQS